MWLNRVRRLVDNAPAARLRGAWRGDRGLACLLASGVLGLYVRTLLPHLGGPEDTPKFQYLGYVLGTAHHPGYPLYVLVSHVFSYLPVGTLAYRMNLLSACFGAATAAVLYVVVRTLGASRAVGVCVAFSLAAGRWFWFNAVVAEVYTLTAFLWSASVLKLLQWHRRGRRRDLYWAAAFVALGLGNHLVIIAIVPAAIAFALAVRAGRPRLKEVLVCIAILAAGLGQYGFIVLRTWQRAAYVESRASSVQELWRIVTARQFAGDFVSEDVRTVFTVRAPELLGMLHEEFGWSGWGSALLGTIVLSQRDSAAAIFLVCGASAVFGLRLAFLTSPAATAGFFQPLFVMVWALAGAGLEAARSAVATAAGAFKAALGVALALLLGWLSVGQIWSNYRVNDRHARNFERTYLTALFRDLPPRSAVVVQNYWLANMFTYARVSGDFRRSAPFPEVVRPDRAIVHQLVERGVRVFAFPAEALQLRGYGFRFERFELGAQTLAEVLDDLPAGTLVAVVGVGTWLPPGLAGRLGVRAPLPQRGGGAFALVGVRGARGGGILWEGRDSLSVHLSKSQVLSGERVQIPDDVDLRATDGGAVITTGETEVRVEKGFALVAFDERGHTVRVESFEERRGFRTALPMGPWPLVEVVGPSECAEIGDRAWHDVTALADEGLIDIRVDNYRPYQATLSLYVASDVPAAARILDFFGGCQGANPCPEILPPTVTTKLLGTAGRQDPQGLSQLRELMALAVGNLPSFARRLTRVDLRVNDEGQFVAFSLDLGARPLWLYARAVTDQLEPRRALVCRKSPVSKVFAAGEPESVVGAGGSEAVRFGAGWHPRERAPDGTFRWSAASEAFLVASLARTGVVEVTVDGRGLERSSRQPRTVRLRVNGFETSAYPLTSQWRTYRWRVPARAWREGLNELAVMVIPVDRPAALGLSDDQRALGLCLRQLRLELVEDSRPTVTAGNERQP